MNQAILNLLKQNGILINDQSNTNYNTGDEIIYNTEVLKSNLCNYNDAYILIRGDISLLSEIM